VIRRCLVLAGFGCLALLVVCLRAEQARSAARIVNLESQWVNARRSLWSLESRAARLRAPRQVHDRTVFLQTGVVPPNQQEPPENPEQLVRSTRNPRHGERAATP
jgi:hypothetical protein